MTDQTFVFRPDAPVQAIVGRFRFTPRGQDVLHAITHEFTSLAQVIQAAEQVGGSTILHLPDSNSVTLVNVGQKTFEAAATRIASAFEI